MVIFFGKIYVVKNMKNYALPIVLIFVIFLCNALLMAALTTAEFLPEGYGNAAGGALGRDGLFILLFSWHPLIGSLLAFGAPLGSDAAKSYSLEMMTLIGCISAITYYLAARIILGKSEILQKAVQSFSNLKWLMITTNTFFPAIIFVMLTVTNELSRALIPYYFENGNIIINDKIPQILVNLFWVQIYVGVMLRIFALIVEKFKGQPIKIRFFQSNEQNGTD